MAFVMEKSKGVVPLSKTGQNYGSIAIHVPYLFGYKTGLSLSRMNTNNQISPLHFAVIRVLPFLNNPKDLDLSYKTDLDFWDCFGRKKHRLISEEIR